MEIAGIIFENGIFFLALMEITMDRLTCPWSAAQ